MLFWMRAISPQLLIRREKSTSPPVARSFTILSFVMHSYIIGVHSFYMLCGDTKTTSGGVPISRRGIYPLRLLGVQISQYAKVQFIVVARIALLLLLCLEDSSHLFLGIVGKSIKFAALFSARFYPIMGELATCEIKKYRPKRSRELGRLFLRFHK